MIKSESNLIKKFKKVREGLSRSAVSLPRLIEPVWLIKVSLQ